VRVFAPAKVNLALHVTGRRADGYHLLDSLVVFADVGDWLEIERAERLSLKVTGPRAAGVPDDARNLVWQAAALFGPANAAAITLEKHLPHAGGIGGGSADAAACLRGMTELFQTDAPAPEAILALGADVPVCVQGKPARMSGIGEILDPVPALPPLWLVLVNAGVEVPTGPVFKGLQSVENAPMPDPGWSDAKSLLQWLSRTHNDLEAPACAQGLGIPHVIDAISETEGCQIARMSGSGGTCFGLFLSEEDANYAAQALRGHAPGWWVQQARVLP